MKWSDILPEEIMQKGDRLAAYADMLIASMDIYPPSGQVFRALSLTPPDKLKCVIVGQDPYHSPGAANGLAFSINPGRNLQPSLENIFKEYHDDTGYPVPASGDLTPWAEHGVLLLNTSLTVQRGCPNSHADWGWSEFTGAVLEAAWKRPGSCRSLSSSSCGAPTRGASPCASRSCRRLTKRSSSPPIRARSPRTAGSSEAVRSRRSTPCSRSTVPNPSTGACDRRSKSCETSKHTITSRRPTSGTA